MIAKTICALLVALLLGGCASAAFKSAYDKPDGKTLMISKSVWDGYKKYLNQIGATYHGAFVVQVYGDRADGYADSYCPGSSCFAGPAFVNQAMKSCRESGGDCVLFALNNDITVNYRVEGQ